MTNISLPPYRPTALPLHQPRQRRRVALAPRLGRSVAAMRSMQPVPLLAETEGIQPVRPIHCEDAVQMIHLVLQQLRAVTLELFLVPVALDVLIPDPDPVGTGDRKSVV